MQFLTPQWEYLGKALKPSGQMDTSPSTKSSTPQEVKGADFSILQSIVPLQEFVPGSCELWQNEDLDLIQRPD